MLTEKLSLNQHLEQKYLVRISCTMFAFTFKDKQTLSQPYSYLRFVAE